MYDPARDAWNNGSGTRTEAGSTPDALTRSSEPGTPDHVAGESMPPPAETPAAGTARPLEGTSSSEATPVKPETKTYSQPISAGLQSSRDSQMSLAKEIEPSNEVESTKNLDQDEVKPMANHTFNVAGSDSLTENAAGTAVDEDNTHNVTDVRPIEASKLPRFKKKRAISSNLTEDSKSKDSVQHMSHRSDEPSLTETRSVAPSVDSQPNLPTQAVTQSQAALEPQTESEAAPEPERKLKRPKSRPTQELEQARSRKRPNQDSQESGSQKRAATVDRSDVVASHYNSRPNTSTQERKKSPIIHLRAFNNFIKSVLIQNFGRRNSVVLDIGIGKGGDLQKWVKQGISGLIGIDIAAVSVDQARDRYEHLRYKPFWADFCVGDAFSRSIEDIVHPDAFPVDIVSSQFAMHYAFSSEERARKLLDNVSRALNPDGVFIGTIPNSDIIAEKIQKLPEGERKFGNSCYTVEFPGNPPTEFRPPFGHEYFFYLEDAVGNVPEYVVPFEAFRGIAQEYRLELVYKKPFLEMFDEETKKNPRLLDLCSRMGVVTDKGEYGIEGDEREACGFYLAFAFKKTR